MDAGETAGANVRRAQWWLQGAPPGSLLALLLAAPSSVSPPAALAQPAALVKDIATSGVNAPPFPFFGTRFVELGGALFFFADDGVHGRELWRSDGAEGGTWMVRDICPGQCVGCPIPELFVHGGAVYFSAQDGVHGGELWRSDGTSEGTALVADVFPGGASSNPAWFTSLGDQLLFATRGEEGSELWRTDGSAAGTALILDIHPSGSSAPGSFVVWKSAAPTAPATTRPWP